MAGRAVEAVALNVAEGRAVLVLAESGDEAGVLLDAVWDELDPDHISRTVRARGLLSLETLAGGEARFVSTRADGGRGYSADLLVCPRSFWDSPAALDVAPALMVKQGVVVVY